MKKQTEELNNELKECTSIQSFVTRNEAEFFEYNTASYLAKLMKDLKLKKIDIVKASNLSEVYAYQILAGMKNPERDKLLCIILAMKLKVEEANQLLKIAGKSELYVKNKRDSILLFALSKQLTVNETNDLLYELEQKILS